jgi:hypothetical protein
MPKEIPRWVKPKVKRIKTWLSSITQYKTWDDPKTIWKPLLLLAAGGGFVVLGMFVQQWIEAASRAQVLGVTYHPLATLNIDALDGYVQTQKVGRFSRNLDDRVLSKYYVAPFRISNLRKTSIGEPCVFNFALGISQATILDVKYVILKPSGKRIEITNSLPRLEWKWPSSIGYSKIYFHGPSDYQFNIYVSLSPKRGFGRFNPTPENGSSVVPIEPTVFPTRWFLKSTLVSPVSEQFSDDVSCVANPAFQAPSFVGEDKSNKFVVAQDYYEFLQGNLSIGVVSGFDPGAEIQFFVLFKTPLRETLSPKVTLTSLPGVDFLEVNDRPTIDTEEENSLDIAKEAAMPERVYSVSLTNEIVVFWDAQSNDNYGGVKLYRSGRRALGNFSEIGELIYQGMGTSNAFEIHNTARVSDSLGNAKRSTIDRYLFSSSGTTQPDDPALSTIKIGNEYFNVMALVTETNGGPGQSRQKLMPVDGLRVKSTTLITKCYHFVDRHPKKGEVYTYTLYALDASGKESYPVVLNAKIDDSATNRTMMVSP